MNAEFSIYGEIEVIAVHSLKAGLALVTLHENKGQETGCFGLDADELSRESFETLVYAASRSEFEGLTAKPDLKKGSLIKEGPAYFFEAQGFDSQERLKGSAVFTIGEKTNIIMRPICDRCRRSVLGNFN